MGSEMCIRDSLDGVQPSPYFHEGQLHIQKDLRLAAEIILLQQLFQQFFLDHLGFFLYHLGFFLDYFRIMFYTIYVFFRHIPLAESAGPCGVSL